MAKIVIDEGHYNCESGAVGHGIRECDVTHDVAYRLKSILESVGHQVLITNGSLSSRPAKANSWGADIFISLHCNASTGSAYGIETFCYKFAYRRLADCVHNALLENNNLYRTNRGVKEGDFCVIRESNMDACLVEMAFIDNAEDNALLQKYPDEYAMAIANGIQSYFGLASISNPKPNLEVDCMSYDGIPQIDSKITMYASSTDSNVFYKFYYEYDGNWTTATDWQEDNKFSFIPRKAGDYKVVCHVKYRSNNTDTEDAYNYMTINIKDKPNIYNMKVNGKYYGETYYEDIAKAVEKEMANGIKEITLVKK